MSGFSTTGASVLTDIPASRASMIMWRQFTAWIGGVGIIVLFLAVLPRLRVGGRQALFKTEMPGPELPLAATIRQTARRFLVLYVAITACEIARPHRARAGPGIDPRMTLFNATAHSFATIATAGFSTEARSLEPFAPATQWVIVVFMLVAGTNFALLYAGIVRRRAGRLRARRGVPRRPGRRRGWRPRSSCVELLTRRRRCAGRTAVRARRLQHRLDDDHDGVRQRRLQRSGRR